MRRAIWRIIVGAALCVVSGAIAVTLYSLLRSPLGPPWLWGAMGAPPALPVSLDLTRVDEAERWFPGPGAARIVSDSLGLRAEGAGADFHLSRRLSLAPGYLGSVSLRTQSPRAPIHVTPYIEWKAKPEDTVIAEIDASDPLRQIAHFYAGRWDHHPVEGFRIQPDAVDSMIGLVEIEITSEKWKPVTQASPDAVDWSFAFSASRRPRNVVLILLDTLRADRMSLYGYARRTTPGLERLGEHGLVFKTARSQAACTFPSVNSLLTSQPPAYFLRQPLGQWAPLDRYEPIAKILQERGFETFAVSSSWVVRASESVHNNWGGGYDAGFDVFAEACAGRSADCVNRQAIDFVDAATGPWFLYLHYLDAHDPYRPPPASHQSAFTRPYTGREEFELGDPNPIAESIYRGRTPMDASERDLEHLNDLYDEEILYLDTQLMLLFTALEERGLLGETMIALVSDHGEEFLEHAHIKHCRSVYDTEIRTPLVFWIPGQMGGRRIRSVAQNLDVVPTLLDYLGAGDAIEGMAGRSLRAAIESDRVVDGHAFSEQGSLQAVSDGRYKLIVDRGDGSVQLFDLAVDRDEVDDLAGERPEVEERLRAALLSWQRISSAEVVKGARQSEENLRALGYLE
ncbi:MAG: sulfatase [bacterium]|nr:sulfatase [bacterium]